MRENPVYRFIEQMEERPCDFVEHDGLTITNTKNGVSLWINFVPCGWNFYKPTELKTTWREKFALRKAFKQWQRHTVHIKLKD